jgi:hypothetical protein
MKTIEQPIIRDGSIIGYRIYSTNGIFGSLSFVGYRWL